MRRLINQLHSFWEDRSAAASVEFVIIAPLYLGLVFSTFEAGWMMTKSMMLERAVDLTARDYRLGIGTVPSHNQLKDTICERALIIRDCDSTIMVTHLPVAGPTDIPRDKTCREVNGKAIQDQMVFLRACIAVKPIFPGIAQRMHLPLDAAGDFALAAYSAYVSPVDQK